MAWAEAVPNLLIGLREGLEAGLVVSILLAAWHRIPTQQPSAPKSSAPIWLGVLAAIAVAASFAAVLTFTTSTLSTRAQEAIGGSLSVVAVGLVTAMIFWMRRTAATMSRRLRGEVTRAVAVGAGALTLTAFLAVGREGLETTLFLWTAVKASGTTTAPLLGAGLGLAAAAVLCSLLYRQAVRINLGAFFSRTAVALIVLAAGVLAYGLGDLQEASLLPGRTWAAFDLTGHVDPTSWWVSLITGVTELSPRMTVLQVVAWFSYLVVVLPLFVRATQPASAPVAASGDGPVLTTWERLVARRPWQLATVLVVVPASAAVVTIAALPAASQESASVSVTAQACAPEWTSAAAGHQVIAVRNDSGKVGEVNLVNQAGDVVAEIEMIAPGTTATMSATLGDGVYSIRCLMAGRVAEASGPVTVTGQARHATMAVQPVTLRDLSAPNRDYRAYVSRQLERLRESIDRIHGDLAAGELAAAQHDWLAAQLAWERVGASYNSFGDAGTAVDGLPDGLPRGVRDVGFTGLHRLEYGLFHGQSTASLLPVVDRLSRDVGDLQRNVSIGDVAGDPTNLPLRAHEILEDALRDHLSGLDNQGGGAAYPMTYADTQATKAVLHDLAPLIQARAPRLMPVVERQLDELAAALLATRARGQWRPTDDVPLLARQRVDASLGGCLETLARVPDLLEIRAVR